MSFADKNLILGQGEGKVISVLGNDIISKAESKDTDGALWVMEYTAGPGFAGPPPHLHRKTTEIFYTLEGELTLELDGRVIQAAAGSFTLVSKGTVHTFSNRGATPTKFLGILTPGGLEGYFEELPEVIEKHGYPPPPQVMMELGKKYDFESPGA